MNMKLSYRDKVVFIVVIVILILVAGFFILIKPKFEEIDSAKYNLETVQQRRNEVDEKIATLPVLVESMKTVAREVGEKQDIFLPEQLPYLNEMYIRDALERCGIEYIGMSTSYTGAGAINRYTTSPAFILAYDNKMTADLYGELPQEVWDAYNRVPGPSYPGAIIGITTVTLTFRSSADLRGAYNVINRIAEDEKTIVLNSIGFENVIEGEQHRDLGVTITMYSINPLNVERVLEETDQVDINPAPAVEAAE